MPKTAKTTDDILEALDAVRISINWDPVELPALREYVADLIDIVSELAKRVRELEHPAPNRHVNVPPSNPDLVVRDRYSTAVDRCKELGINPRIHATVTTKLEECLIGTHNLWVDGVVPENLAEMYSTRRWSE